MDLRSGPICFRSARESLGRAEEWSGFQTKSDGSGEPAPTFFWMPLRGSDSSVPSAAPLVYTQLPLGKTAFLGTTTTPSRI